jgi:hypothetical protein
MLSLNFNSTNEAVKFGLEHKGEEKTINLMMLFYAGLKMSAKEYANKDEQVCINILTKAQFVREAYQTAQGISI